MKIDPRTLAAAAVVLVAALAVGASGQDKPRSGVLNVRECMDKARNEWMADIDQDLLKMQEATSGRANDLNPQERARIRTKHLDHYNKRRLELYAALVRIAGEVAKERGLDVVHRIDRMPVAENGDPDVLPQIYSRDIVHADPGLDLTNVVLERLNKEHAGRKK
jgi:Skp family chaperone for outer membrane proteins